MLSSFRIRIGNISPSATQWHFPLWKWRTNPQNLRLFLARYGRPSNTAVPRPTAHTTPNRGTVGHRRRKFPIGYNGASQICTQKYPFPWTDPQTPLPALSLDPPDLWCQTASGSDPPFFHNALDRPRNVRTDRPTDRSSTGKFDDYSPLRL